MSLVEKIKHLFHTSKGPAPHKPGIIDPDEIARLERQVADETARREAENRRYNEYLASERLREEQEKYARLERIRKEEQLKELRINEQRRAEQERLRQQQAEEARLEEIRAQERLRQQRLIEQQLAEQERLKEQKEKERRGIEIERLMQIHALNQSETYLAYLREAERFRKDYGKNIKCDICGEWESGLVNHRGQTYCQRHIPVTRHTENVHKVTAGRHGSSKSYIKR